MIELTDDERDEVTSCCNRSDCNGTFDAVARVVEGRLGPSINAADLDRLRSWSLETFGPGPRWRGHVDHIRKELAEIEAEPTDVEEWVDVILLALDGALISGHEPQEVIDAIKAKQAKNEARAWPDWRTQDPDKATEHIR